MKKEQKNDQVACFRPFELFRVQPITEYQLGRTIMERDDEGNFQNGIPHFELLEKINKMANEHGYLVRKVEMLCSR